MTIGINATSHSRQSSRRIGAWIRIQQICRRPLVAIERTYRLAAPYGRRELFKTFAVSICQSVVQVIGVASIGPFIAVVTSPDSLRDILTRFGPLQGIASLDDKPLLIGFGIVLVAINAGCCVLNIAAERKRATYSQQVGLFLREQILCELLNTPYDRFARRSSSVILNNINTNTERFSGLVLLPSLELFSKGLLVVFLVLLMLVVSPALTLLAATTVSAGYVVIFWLLSRRRAALSRSLGTTGRETTQAAQELLHGFKVVRTSNAESYFAGRYHDNAIRRADCLARVPVLAMAPKYLMETIALATMVLLAVVAIGSGHRVEDFLPTLGLLAFAAYRILPTLQQIYHHATTLSTSWFAVEEMELELLQDRIESDPNARPPLLGSKQEVVPLSLRDEIRVQDVCYRYPNSQNDTLKHVSLVIPRNSCLGICGPSGAGKSTFVDVILGLLRPTSGHISVDGTPLDVRNLRSWREIVAYVPQDIFLIDDTLERNIAFGVPDANVDRERVRQACVTAQLDSWVQELPEGLGTKVGDRGMRLSGGQRQRVALARGLYRQPDVLILDEATSALDQQTETAFMECLERLHGQLTMIMIAHRLSTLEMCDRVVNVKDGEVLECESKTFRS